MKNKQISTTKMIEYKGKVFLILLLLWAVPLQAEDNPLVRVNQVIPDIVEDVRYATENNFTGKKLYPVGEVYLKKSVVEKLKIAADDLRQQGYRLKIFDGYRPHSIQFIMWDATPHKKYVADPKKGSYHNRGGAVDLTLITSDGQHVEMPSEYDDFSTKAHHDNALATKTEIKNANVLKAAMVKAGFKPVNHEWWHYQDPATASWPVMDVKFEELH